VMVGQTDWYVKGNLECRIQNAELEERKEDGEENGKWKMGNEGNEGNESQEGGEEIGDGKK